MITKHNKNNKKLSEFAAQLKKEVEGHQTQLKDFKRELQRLYAPKVKICLQSEVLKDENFF